MGPRFFGQEVTPPETASRVNVTDDACRKPRERRKRSSGTDRRGIIEDYFVLVLNHPSTRSKKRRVSRLCVITVSTCEKVHLSGIISAGLLMNP